MIKESCLYYEKCKDMGATIDWCCNYPHLNFDCEKCERYIEKDFVRVVRCNNCIYQTECAFTEWLGRNGNGFCSSGERRENGHTER